jgi:hypothetical protein
MAYLIKPKEGPAVAQPASHPEARSKDIFPPVPRWVGVSAIIWLVLIQVGTEFWYRSHESKLVSNTTWAFAWPVQDANFHKDAIPQTSLAILRCTDSQSANWVDDGGNDWSVFLLRWSPGRNSEQLAKVHKPEICFPAAGAKLLDDFGRVTLKPNGVSMTFHDQSFSTGAGLIHVFYCLWSDRIAPGEDTTKEQDNNSQAGRIRAVLAGKRNLGQQVLEIVIHGPESNDDAVKVLQQSLPNLIKRT